MENKEKLTAAIIAGGLSERFGEHKTRVKIGNRELIDFAIQLAKSLSDQVIIVHGDQDDYADKHLPHVADIVPRCGPMGGIYTALTVATSPFVATIPADVPLLPAIVYELLWQEMDQRVPTVAISHRGIEPLIGIFPRQVAGAVKNQIQQKNFSLHEFLKAIRAREIPIAEKLPGYHPDWFLNINFQKDLKIIEKKLNLN